MSAHDKNLFYTTNVIPCQEKISTLRFIYRQSNIRYKIIMIQIFKMKSLLLAISYPLERTLPQTLVSVELLDRSTNIPFYLVIL